MSTTADPTVTAAAVDSTEPELNATVTPDEVATPATPLPSEADELVQAIFGLFGAARRLRGRDQQRTGELSHSQLRIVTYLLDAGEPLPAGALARAVELNPASMTAAIDHLEQRGVVRREPFPGDRRVVLVRLTDEGRALVVAKRDAWDSRWHEALAQVDPADLAVTAKTLQRVSALVDGL